MSTECFSCARHCAKRFTKEVSFKAQQYGICALRTLDYKWATTGSRRMPHVSKVTSKCPQWELNPTSLNFITLVFSITQPDSAPMCTHWKLLLMFVKGKKFSATVHLRPQRGTTTVTACLAANTVSCALVEGKPQEPMGTWISAWPLHFSCNW